MDNIVPLMRQWQGARHEPRTQRPAAVRPRGGRGQLQPRGRARRAAQIDRVAAHGRRSKRSSASGCCCAPRASSRVTDFGHSVLEHAHQVVAEVDGARRRWPSTGRSSRAAGCACRCPPTSPTCVLAQLLAEFVARVSGDLARARPVAAPRRPDRRELRRRDAHGRPAPTMRRWRRAASRCSPAGLYASPAYLQRHGAPQEPEALMEHDALRMLGAHGEPMPWVLPAAKHAGKASRPAAPPPTHRNC